MCVRAPLRIILLYFFFLLLFSASQGVIKVPFPFPQSHIVPGVRRRRNSYLLPATHAEDNSSRSASTGTSPMWHPPAQDSQQPFHHSLTAADCIPTGQRLPVYLSEEELQPIRQPVLKLSVY